MAEQNPNQAAQNQQQQQQPSAFDELRGKKGFKDNDAFAKSYTEVEQSYGRTQNALNQAKTQIEANSQGMYTLDDKGTIIITEQGKQAQNQQYQQPGQQYQQQDYQQNVVYDPLTNQPITDPQQLAYVNQLSRIPFGMREAAVFNLMADAREKQQTAAFQHETEILGSEAAKGFEQDIKKVMMQIPLMQRADKKNWENAVLQVKGARYDQDKQTWSQQGEESLLNKMGNQGLPPAGGGAGGGSGTQLPQNLETQWQWYAKNRPGLFKDRQEFLNYTTPSGGK